MKDTIDTNAYGMTVVKQVLKHKIKSMGWYELLVLLEYIFDKTPSLKHDSNGDLAIVYQSDSDPIEKELAKITEMKMLKDRFLCLKTEDDLQ